MSTELALNTMGDKLAYARQLSDNAMLPPAYRKNPGNVLWAIEFGNAMGVAPVVAMGMIHVIEGKPSASALMLAGLVRKAGHRLRVESDDTRAVATIARSDDPEFWFKAEFSMTDAGKAGVLGNPNWKKWPRNMMEARAISAVARKACSEVLLGVEYIAEELGGPPAAEDLPKGAVVVSDGRWSDAERARFCAQIGDMGLKYEDVAAWTESLGRGRPSAMKPKTLQLLLDSLGADGRQRFDAWKVAQAQAVTVEVDSDGVVADEQFFTEPQTNDL